VGHPWHHEDGMIRKARKWLNATRGLLGS
jgi:hypothetical protein